MTLYRDNGHLLYPDWGDLAFGLGPGFSKKKDAGPVLEQINLNSGTSFSEVCPLSRGFIELFGSMLARVEEEINGLLNFLDIGGNWHPEDPISVKALGAQEDYLEVFEFPCCGASVLSDRPPSRFRSDGCKVSPSQLGNDN